ncbi:MULTISPECIES: DsrE/DsrF/DrsH-like family protein [unclassified Fusibacter]|uniref:DsrE/DsrF/DrsH-like family protein n=1 Tax=unclassified Fusibacter TaxID=2624464 RepID=UPI001012446D|nr:MULTISPECIES: DsrE/DsrF/DrsH-like family protein [unclassified Fusibacter]MCK8059234.1 DsrE/DsrF/DrsH-like family protein [Fusibacter sp. A2]NPE21302.1 FAD-dependent oxidoreductase [Fusibacter sp. A1]RXV62566.1 pyridine nucleotide-disulfide oxidoreductase [Fusibacter sp. A1]
MDKKVLIVGGVAGGASTAARLRRLDENVEIIMFEKGDYISFANCGLPYYIGETIKERDLLLVQTPEAMKARFNIDVRVKNKVVDINREAKTVKVEKVDTGETYEESYDVLVLSPGSTPLKPPIQGIDSPNIFTLWDIPDTDAIKNFVDTIRPRRAAVIGGGFIGIEMAENFSERGLDVTLIEKADQVMTPIDKDMAEIVHHHLGDQGVRLFLNDGVQKFEYKNGVTTIYLESGETVDAEIVMLSIGVKPQSELARLAKLPVNARGGIIVDKHMKTEDPNIYALGDAIEVDEFITGEKAMVPLAGPANKQGRIVANNICGIEETYKGTQGTSIAKVYDLTVANTGLNEKTLARMGKIYKKDYHSTLIHVKSHAGYYPGAIPMALKLIYATDGKILGSQAVGYVGVDKRIDVIATAIRFGGTVNDLKNLELAYAPPYSSAKDPANMIAFVAENVLTGKMDYVNAHEMTDIDFDKTIILDVRDPEERDFGFVEGSMNIPVNSLRERVEELDRTKEIIIYCAIGLRGYVASRILNNLGFENVKNLNGGYTSYKMVHSDIDHSCPIPSEEADADFNDSGDSDADQSFNEGTGVNVKLNACGLQCPGPIMQVYKRMDEMNRGDILEVAATDPGFASDIKTWCKRTGNTLIDSGKRSNEFYAVIKKGHPIMHSGTQSKMPEDKSMVVFSGEFDKAVATFIIANGATAMGRQVTLFFTFWGLNILRKHDKVSVKKDFLARMFSGMMPRGSKRLGLSNMHMFGMGPKMVRMVMKKHNVDSLEELMQQAIDNGVRIVACTMSMDLMGITKDELIDGIEFGGVASYLGAAEESNVNLFI